ncbi:MAG: XRE family transcriptional regulator [Ruminococcus sp.]
MKKSTDELMKILRSKDSVDDYFQENDSEIFFGSLTELIQFFISNKRLEKKDVVRDSGLSRTYAYEIISGKTNKNISRDKVIMLCFGLHLTVDEAQQMLKKSGYAPLYARDTRDSILIFSLENSISVVNTNIKLAEYNLTPLE